MSMLNIAAVVFTGLLLSVILKKISPEYSVLCSIVCGVLIIIMLLPWIGECFSFFDNIVSKMPIDNKYIQIIIKAVGTAYIAQFIAEMCEDAGENTLASRIEMAEKIYLTVLSLPIFVDIIGIIDKYPG